MADFMDKVQALKNASAQPPAATVTPGEPTIVASDKGETPEAAAESADAASAEAWWDHLMKAQRADIESDLSPEALKELRQAAKRSFDRAQAEDLKASAIREAMASTMVGE